MNLPCCPAVALPIQSQPLVDRARHGPLALEAESLPVGRNPRGGLRAMAVLFTPELVFAVELGGRYLGVSTSDALVFNKECRHIVVFPELLCGVLDAVGDIEVSALVESVQALKSPVEDPCALGLDVALYLRVLLAFWQLREG